MKEEESVYVLHTGGVFRPPPDEKAISIFVCAKKKGQGVRMYRSKSVEILAKNKTITYCECECKKLAIRLYARFS